MKRVLITGASGLLGPYLAQHAALGPVTLSARRHGDHQCDLTDPQQAARLIEEAEPDIVFHCAAMTDVDGCERDPAAAHALNCGAVANLVRALPPASALVLFSTDQVYPDVAGPHAEGSEQPVNVYGKSKLAGEAAAMAHANALVLRVNFFGPSQTPGRASLSDWLIVSLRDRQPVTLFTDSIFSPLHLKTLAGTAAEAVSAGLRGIFNLGSREGMSKADFGLSVARRLGLQTGTVKLGASAKLPGRALRPADMRMAVAKIESAMGRAMPALAQEIMKL